MLFGLVNQQKPAPAGFFVSGGHCEARRVAAIQRFPYCVPASCWIAALLSQLAMTVLG